MRSYLKHFQHWQQVKHLSSSKWNLKTNLKKAETSFLWEKTGAKHWIPNLQNNGFEGQFWERVVLIRFRFDSYSTTPIRVRFVFDLFWIRPSSTYQRERRWKRYTVRQSNRDNRQCQWNCKDIIVYDSDNWQHVLDMIVSVVPQRPILHC